MPRDLGAPVVVNLPTERRLAKEKKKKKSPRDTLEPVNLKSIRQRRERLEAMIQSRRLPPLPSSGISNSNSNSRVNSSVKKSQNSLSPHWREDKAHDRRPTPQPGANSLKLSPLSRSRGSTHDRLPNIIQRPEDKDSSDGDEDGIGRADEMEQQMTKEIQQLMQQQMQMMNQLLKKQKEQQDRRRRKQEKLQQLQMQKKAQEETERRAAREDDKATEEEVKPDEDKKGEEDEKAETESDKNDNQDGAKNEDKENQENDEAEGKKEEEEEEGDEEEDISDEVDELVAGLRSGEVKRQVKCAERTRQLLSSPHPPVVQLIQAGALPPLVSCMERGDSPQLQVEAAWSITNVASGSSAHTWAVVDAGAIPVLVRLLVSADKGVQEQAVWALGNIVGDGAECRDRVLAAGVTHPLVNLIQPNMSSALRRQVCWVLTNLFRVRGAKVSDSERWECVQGLQVLIGSLDSQVQADALWGAAYLAESSPGAIDDLASAGVVRDMVERLYSDTERVVTAALRATGSVAAGTDEQTDAVVQSGALPIYRELLAHHNPGIARESAWILSNITAGTSRQIQLVIDVQVVPALIAATEKTDTELRKEATWALSNLASGSTDEQVAVLVKAGLLPCLCRLLQSRGGDPGMTLVALDALNNVLKKSGSDLARVVQMAEANGGKDALESLKTHSEPQVTKMATYLLQTYFEQELEEE